MRPLYEYAISASLLHNVLTTHNAFLPFVGDPIIERNGPRRVDGGGAWDFKPLRSKRRKFKGYQRRR